jgi:hypothetical protein
MSSFIRQNMSFFLFFLSNDPDTSALSTAAILFQTFPAKVAGKFGKNSATTENTFKATFQTHFVQRKQKKIQYYCKVFSGLFCQNSAIFLWPPIFSGHGPLLSYLAENLAIWQQWRPPKTTVISVVLAIKNLCA